MDRDRDRPCVDQHNTQGNYRKITSNCRKQKWVESILGRLQNAKQKLRPDT
jgi:hypothetical protein